MLFCLRQSSRHWSSSFWITRVHNTFEVIFPPFICLVLFLKPFLQLPMIHQVPYQLDGKILQDLLQSSQNMSGDLPKVGGHFENQNTSYTLHLPTVPPCAKSCLHLFNPEQSQSVRQTMRHFCITTCSRCQVNR